MKRETLQAIALLIILLLICFADSFAQDNRSKYWNYCNLMNEAQRNKDTSMQRKYLDSMNNYNHFDARNIKH